MKVDESREKSLKDKKQKCAKFVKRVLVKITS